MSRARGLGAAGSSRRVVPTAAERRRRAHVEPEPAAPVVTAEELERAFTLAPEAAARALGELSRIIREAKP